MTPLASLLAERIKAEGPISLHDFMQEALFHPEFGYYVAEPPFGAKGDFVTAPEISQMFGELIGLWTVDCWAKLGAPSLINLIELGPGNGTLMQDALRSAKLAPEFIQALNIHMVEASDQLQSVQREKLKDHEISWHKNFPDNVQGPCLIIGNEFLDALPIRQFVYSNPLLERHVALDENGFCFEDLPIGRNSDADPTSFGSLEEGDIFEICPGALDTVRNIARMLTKNSGAALFLDYGSQSGKAGDSFQAVRHHKFSKPLENPGQSDLTAHVDFKRLVQAADQAGCKILPIESQGRFLERLGIEARVLQLSKNASEIQKEQITSAHRRLVSSEEMGTLFKAMSFYCGMMAPPAGFGD
ncbi:MAG: SAM-dependent methyltransferase [Sneathiellales bacterium]|nr:SAM-dependent methyltransferase [Sneathiellales bacterium]